MGAEPREDGVTGGVMMPPSRPDLTGWQIHTSKIPVAVECANPTWPDGDGRLLHDLAVAIAYGFDQITEMWVAAHVNTDVAGYVFALAVQDSETAASGTPPMRVADVDTVSGPRGTIAHAVFSVDSGAIVAAADADITVMRRVMAASIGEAVQLAGVPEATVTRLVEEWDNAPNARGKSAPRADSADRTPVASAG